MRLASIDNVAAVQRWRRHSLAATTSLLTSTPTMLAIVGDSGAGKTTLSRGLHRVLPGLSSSFCTDHYHRYDRFQRQNHDYSILHPDANYVDIMEQHLQLLASGHSVLRPTYDHRDGLLKRPQQVDPSPFIVVNGVLAMLTPNARSCFDVQVYIDQPEQIRRRWKIVRDTSSRGYTKSEVFREIARCRSDSVEYVQPQKHNADIVIQYEPAGGQWNGIHDPLDAKVYLRPTIQYPDLAKVLPENAKSTISRQLVRDAKGRPVDRLSIKAFTPPEITRRVQEAIWHQLMVPLPADDPLSHLGEVVPGLRSEPLALIQLLLLYVLVDTAQQQTG